jgi:hypothetical protein
MVRKLLFGTALLAVLLFAAVGIATAATPGTSGQPNQSCQNPANLDDARERGQCARLAV